MNVFAGLDMEEIAAKYKYNEGLLRDHLRGAGLMAVTTPKCHGGEMTTRAVPQGSELAEGKHLLGRAQEALRGRESPVHVV